MNHTQSVALPINISQNHITATPAMIGHIRERVTHALQRFGAHVRTVDVHVADSNGHKGGEDKVCSIHAQIDRSPTVIITHTASDYYVAVSNAAKRLKATLGRRLSKRP
jgi:putative sigma-54 modulation protein